MSKGQALRALVSERLAAAAEEIFVLFERTITEYEEELSRSKEESRRKQQLLDKVLSQRIKLVKESVHVPSTHPDLDRNQTVTVSSGIKEEPEDQGVKQAEEQLPEHLPEPGGASLMEEHRELSSDTDNSDDWRAPFSSSGAQMEPEAVGDGGAELFLQNWSASGTSVQSGPVSGAEEKKHQCLLCDSRFGTKRGLQFHIRVHAGEKPFSCSNCNARFTQKSLLREHQRTHTGGRPYSCDFCGKTFAYRSNRDSHLRIHTGEKPYSCSNCEKHFADPSSLRRHKRTHTGEKPHCCFVCNRAFAQKYNLKHHMRTHRL